MLEKGGDATSIAEREGLLQVGDDSQLANWVDQVFAENPDESRRFAEGDKKLLGVLVGLVMKKSKGRADPRKVNQMIVGKSKDSSADGA